jgi:hypothetical protein
LFNTLSAWLRIEKLAFSVDNNVKITTAKTMYTEAYCVDLESKLKTLAKKSLSDNCLNESKATESPTVNSLNTLHSTVPSRLTVFRQIAL